MFVAMGRVILGFAFACLVAATVKVMFAVGPQSAFTADPERLRQLLLLIAQFATVFAVFASLFVLLAAVITEWQGIRSIVFYLLVGLAIAGTGFCAQYLGEAPSAATVFNNFGITAYLVTGLAGGFAYWLVCGRYAGDEDDIYVPVKRAAAAPLPPAPAQPLPSPPAKATPSAPAAAEKLS